MLIYLSMIDNMEDREIFEIMYEKYKYKMLYIARKYKNSKVSDEDVVHDTFIKLIKYMDTFKKVAEDKRLAYLITMTKNTALASHKIKEIELNENFRDLNEESALDVLCKKEGSNQIIFYIDKLDEIYKTILELKYLYGLSNTEIETILDIKTETLNKRLYRAKRKLREIIEKGNNENAE